MPTATLHHSTPTSAAQPIEPTPAPGPADPFAGLWDELAGYHAQAKAFATMEPDEVTLMISGIAARVSEVRAHLARSQNRAATSFRLQIVEPLLADLEFQFKLHSRVQSYREMDLRLAGGQP